MRSLGHDFWSFWAGQTISNFGSSITQFALPLLVYQLTGSALDLGIAFAAGGLPYPLFGLAIGAWTDRVDRKRLMIGTDLARAVVVATVPAAAALGVLSVTWIYVVLFVSTTLSIAFDTAEFAVIPALVRQDDLVTANGRIQASFSAASIVGPLVAGALLAVIALPALIAVDAASFLVSAASVGIIRGALQGRRAAARDLRAEIVEGLRYVLRHPVLRNISIMMALVNFIGSSMWAQIILFAKVQYAATDAEIGLLFSAGGIGVVVLSLAAGPLRRRWSFGVVALGSLMLGGLATVATTVVPWYGVGVVLWAVRNGLGTLFNINTGSLRQAIVPEHLLGRIRSVAAVLAWSANPLGAIAGAYAVERTGNVVLVYAVIGVATFLIPLYFYLFSPLGHAERYTTPLAEPA